MHLEVYPWICSGINNIFKYYYLINFIITFTINMLPLTRADFINLLIKLINVEISKTPEGVMTSCLMVCEACQEKNNKIILTSACILQKSWASKDLFCIGSYCCPNDYFFTQLRHQYTIFFFYKSWLFVNRYSYSYHAVTIETVLFICKFCMQLNFYFYN